MVTGIPRAAAAAVSTAGIAAATANAGLLPAPEMLVLELDEAADPNPKDDDAAPGAHSPALLTELLKES